MSFVLPDTVPDEWSTAKLGQLFQERNERVSDADFSPLSVTMDGIVPQLDHVALTQDNDNRKLVRAGDIVINSRSDRKGAAGQAPRDGSVAVISTVLEARTGHGRFFHYLLRSQPFQEEFYRQGKGIHSDLWTTRYDQMKRIEVAVPPEEIQRAIADFLDRETGKIDTLIEKKQRLLELLDEKRTALITRAVTRGLDPDVPMKDSEVEWIGEIPEHWEVVRVKHLVQQDGRGLQMGPYGSMLTDLVQSDTGYRVFGQENTISGDFTKGHRWVTEDQYAALRRYSVKQGDILLTRKGSIGNARLVQHDIGPGIIDSDTIRLRVKSDLVSQSYLVLNLHSSDAVQGQIEAQRRGAVLSGLNTSVVGNLKIPVPPRAEQDGIMDAVEESIARLEFLRSKVADAVSLLREYRTALISAAVTGKVDAPEMVPA